MPSNRLATGVLVLSLCGWMGVIAFAPGSRVGDGGPVFFRLLGVDEVAGLAIDSLALPVLVVSAVVGIGGRFLGMALWMSAAGDV